MSIQHRISEKMKESQDLLRSMTRIRMVEEEISRRYSNQQMRCPVHLSIGQEASAVGVCEALQPEDWVFSGHRNHAHYLAKGGDLKAMLAEIYGKVTGCCGGRGGSMHLTDQAAGFIGATPIVGSTVPIAVGAALTAKRERKKRVVVVFLGDGAMEAGVVHESMNFAALKNLPIVFACENNLYSVYSPLSVRQPPGRTILDVARGHGIKAIQVDGNNVHEVLNKTLEAVDGSRRGKGPVFMELSTYRWLEHCGPGYDNNLGYREEKEFLDWKERDPLEVIKKESSCILSSSVMDIINEEIQDAFAQAINDPYPDTESAKLHVYATCSNIEISPSSEVRELSYAEAIRDAQEISLIRDKRAYIMGLGVPDPKGIFGSTVGLQKRFGENRVFDIPLSENAITGVAIGSAITGLRPVLTHQRLDFSLVSIDQIVNQAAKWHYMFNGKMDVPVIIRMVIGRGWGQGPQHSQSLHAWFAHIPGLRVVMPSSPEDAKGMFLSAATCNSPVIILEHRWLYDIRGNVPVGYYTRSLVGAVVLREGRDITLVSTGYGVIECLKARELLEEYDISAEVIDLRSVRPLDTNTIIASVQKTKGLIVLDHGEKVCGLSSEILASIVEAEIEVPRESISRITIKGHPCPTSYKLSENYYPGADDILEQALKYHNIKVSSRHDTVSVRGHHDQPDSKYMGPF